MKRVLILAYDFPPYTSIAGQRPASWLRYFKQAGIEPVVVTRHWDSGLNSYIDCIRKTKNSGVTETKEESGTIIRVPYSPNVRDKFLLRFGEQRFVFLRKAISFVLEILKFHFFFADNRSAIYHEAKKLMARQHFDALIATGEPFILFRYAALLSQEFHVPWIADYRDGWTTDRIHPATSFAQKVLLRHARLLEQRSVSTASLLTTASPTYQNDLQPLFPAKRIKVVYNGYDDDTLYGLPDVKQDKQIFRIAYAGTLYAYQRLEIFLEGFRRFIQKSGARNVRVLFYGVNFHPEQAHRVATFDSTLSSFLELTGKISYPETLQELRRASLLLLLGAKGNNTLSAKIFDYLAVQRKILFVENDHGILEEILQKTQGGICCANVEEVCAALEQCYAEHAANGFVSAQTTGFEYYSRKNQAHRLAELLHSL